MWSIVITLIMLLAIIVLLMKGVSSPGVIFMGVPIIGALLMGYSFTEINDFIGTGLNSVVGTIYLMVMAVMFFGILRESGVFDLVVRFITKFLKNSIPSTMLVAMIISMLTQLGGSGAAASLCTIPTMRPLFEKQKIRREALMLIVSIGTGMMLLLPYMPGFVENTSYVGINVVDAYGRMIPVLVFGIVLAFVACFPLALVEKRHGAGMTDEEFNAFKEEMMKPAELPKGKGVAAFNGIFTLVCLLGILLKMLPINLTFGFGFVILLFVNYHSPKEQADYIMKNAGPALNMAFTMLGVAVLVGVNGSTGAMGELAAMLTQNMSADMIRWILPVFCILGVPINMLLGNSVGPVIVPALVSIMSTVGVSAMEVQPACWASMMLAANLCLFNASPYLGLGLCGVEMKDHLKYSFLPIWGFEIILVIFMLVTGLLPL